MIRADRMNNINFEIIEMAHSFEFAAYKAIAKTKGLFFLEAINGSRYSWSSL